MYLLEVRSDLAQVDFGGVECLVYLQLTLGLNFRTP